MRMTWSEISCARSCSILPFSAADKIVRELIDLFGGGEDLLRRLRGAGGNRLKLVRDTGEMLGLDAELIGCRRAAVPPDFGRAGRRRAHHAAQRGERLHDLAVMGGASAEPPLPRASRAAAVSSMRKILRGAAIS